MVEGEHLVNLVFMADNSTLIRDGDGDISGLVQYDALTCKAAFESRIERAVDKILLFIRNPFQKIIPLIDINVTSGTRANPTTIMVEVNIVILCNFKDRQIN